jgi:PAS domain S-box-containing protein
MGGSRKTGVTDPQRESEDGRYLAVNRAFCEITGHAEAELLATDFQSITHPEDVAASLRGRQQLVAALREDARRVGQFGSTKLPRARN